MTCITSPLPKMQLFAILSPDTTATIEATVLNDEGLSSIVEKPNDKLSMIFIRVVFFPGYSLKCSYSKYWCSKLPSRNTPFF